MKKLLVLFSFVAIAMILTSCDHQQSSDSQLTQKQEELMKEAVRQVGMPNIVNYAQRKQLKMIQELCDQEKLICYAYYFSEVTGKPIYLGKCIGFGLPYSTQYTSPDKWSTYRGEGGSGEARAFGTIAQPDPNGLYMPSSADATWILLIDPATGDVHPIYFEPKCIISPFPLPNVPRYDDISKTDSSKVKLNY